MVALKSGVATAIEELRANFAQFPIEIGEIPCGGAHVVISDVPLGKPFAQDSTWVGFFLSSACPDDDTYPFFVREDLSFLDGRLLSVPFHGAQVFPLENPSMPPRPAVMVSRRQSNQACWSSETPLLKLLKVLKWMSER
jgi:hypothetical protein